MFRDEYLWSEAGEQVVKNATLLIRGVSDGERETTFLREWQTHQPECTVLQLASESNDKCRYRIAPASNIDSVRFKQGNIRTDLRNLLSQSRSSLQSVVMDITSLQHVAIMFITKFLLELVPGQLFAVYAEPVQYTAKDAVTGEYNLSDRSLGIMAVPGFAKMQQTEHEVLVAFMGFEGGRLARLLEERRAVETIISVVGLPSYRPGWNLVSLASAGQVLVERETQDAIHVCAAFSVFEAISELYKIRSSVHNKTLVLAPLGTRPHTLAIALFAARNEGTQILFDHPVETSSRSQGLGERHVYHLSGLVL